MLVFCRATGGRPGLIHYTLNQSCLANHFPVSRWENNTADQSKLHSFPCYLLIYCPPSHVSHHRPDCGIGGGCDRSTEKPVKRVKQSKTVHELFLLDACTRFFTKPNIVVFMRPFTEEVYCLMFTQTTFLQVNKIAQLFSSWR